MSDWLGESDAEEEADAQPDGSAPRTERRLWPWILFVASMMLLDLLVFPAQRVVSRSGSQAASELIIVMGLGCISAQACLAAVIGGLFCRSWISGYLIATSLAVVGVTLLLSGEFFSMLFFYGSVFRWQQTVTAILCTPAFVLAISMPMLAFRQFYGWRLTRSARGTETRHSIGLEELFIGTAITAAMLMLLRSAQDLEQVQSSQFWVPVAVIFSVMATASLVIVAPTVWVAFRVESFRRRLGIFALLATGFSTFVVITLLGVNIIINRSGAPASAAGEVVFFTAGWMIAASITLVIGLTVLRACGFVLARQAEKPVVGGGAGSVAGVPEISRYHRVLAAVVFAGALAINLGVSGFIGLRDSQEETLQAMHRELDARGGGLRVGESQNTIDVALGTGATADDLRKVPEYHDVVTLSLASSEIHDADLKLLAAFPHLRKLDLSRTSITDAGLRELRGLRLRSLEELSLAETRVTIDGILESLASHDIMALDLGQLELTDSDLDRLAKQPINRSHPLRTVSLRGNPISEEAIVQFLMRQPSLLRVDLTDCDMDGQGLRQLPKREFIELTLDGTRLNDQTLAPWLKSLTARQLSFDRTGVTDAILPSLATAVGVSGLALSETQVTERGLANCDIQVLENLSLNSPKFDGSCFATWKPLGLRELSMSHSGVTDRAIKNIAKLTQLQRLDLSNTSITDAALAELAKSSVRQIDLSGTRVTAAGLAASGLSAKTIHLAIGQFSVTEFKNIRKRIRVSFRRLDN